MVCRPRLMPKDLFMNSDESKHHEVPETPQDGKHSVAPESPASPETNRLLPYSTQSSAPTEPTAETNNKPAAKSPSNLYRLSRPRQERIMPACYCLRRSGPGSKPRFLREPTGT